MVRLLGIGPGKAEAIVEYRSGGGGFERCSDLQKVSGIGPGTVENIRPWVCFE